MSVGKVIASRARLALVGSEVEQELEDRWWFGLGGTTVESVDAYEFQVVVGFGGGSGLTIESAANLRAAPDHPEVQVVTLGQDGIMATTDALRSLVGQRLTSGVGFKSGALRLVFASGAKLTMPPGEHYEAWQLTGPSGRLWVSLPGGGLATFPPSTA